MTGKPFYTDYARHMFRYYIPRRDDKSIVFHSDAEKLNFGAAQRTMGRMIASERVILEDVYLLAGDTRTSVQSVAKSYNTNENNIWQILNRAEKLIAKERGLI